MTTPAPSSTVVKPLAWNLQTCDGGSHRRKDRLNGGMYITPADISLTLSAVNPTTQCVIVQPPYCKALQTAAAPHSPTRP